MTATVIPLQAVAAQHFDVALGSQACTIRLYQRRGALYFDLLLDQVNVALGVVCRDRNYLVRAAYSGFVGELYFLDLQGTDDPTYSGLGSRFILVYEDSPE